MPAGALHYQAHALPTPVVFDRRVAVVGLDGDVASGARRVSLTAWLLVTGELAGRLKPELTIGFSGTKATSTLPLTVYTTPLEWRVGDVVMVSGAVDVPAGAAPGPVVLGVQDAGRRWPARGGDVVIGTLDERSSSPPRLPWSLTAPTATSAAADDDAHAVRREGPVVVDGRFDEPDWQRAPVRTLVPYRTGSPVSARTTVRFLWDDDAIYVAFDVDDDDPFSPYTKRDDPLYESEALELFLDADGDADVYVELQSNVHDVHFDAAFSGGPRKNMQLGYDLDFETRTATRPGGYGMEWRIPVAGVLDVPSTTLVAGSSWSIQAFRLERRRDDSGAVIATEASSLWPIERNDFHALDRMGRLIFDAAPAPFETPGGSLQ